MKHREDTIVLSASTDAEAGERLAAQMAAAWAHGERLPAEHYLDRHPELFEVPEVAARLIYEEVCLREERGEEVSVTEMEHRFPRWKSELSVLLDCHRLVDEHLAPPQFPAVGEPLGDFRLLGELGRGRNGRVYLAVQPMLADRPVVLKVTSGEDGEFLSLARLQHTNIIPLYGVHDFPARNLRALCQPYFGGGSLARLLEIMQPVGVAQRTGRSLVDALDQIGCESPLPHPVRGPREVFAKAAYSDVICWIGICLAEALHHAHERGLVHLDLKPSNVLIGSDGQPLLLDFHLSLHPLVKGQAVPAGMGGTLEFMSPEQRAAYIAGRCGLPAPQDVDRRSDVYSLGKLLYAALAGESGDGTPALQRCNPQVSVGLADIIHRCLAEAPGDRYANAALLAADLRLHLADMPLRGAPNRSLGERWRKWSRRRTVSLLGAGLLLALVVAGVTLGTTAFERLHNAREALREGQTQIQQGSYPDAARTLNRGKTLAETLPGCGNLVEEIDLQLRRARRGNAVDQLHFLTERLRLFAGSDDLPERELRAVEIRCRTFWEMRDLVAGTSSAPLRESLEKQARADLIDLAILWTDLRLRLAPGEQTVKTEAHAALSKTQSLCGPNPALTRALQALDGTANLGDEPTARTFQEHAALGRALLRMGSLDRAAEELARAVELRPQDFWSHYYSGVCAYRRGRHLDAVASLNVAIALAPEFAEVFYNRALAHTALGETAAALRDYDRALELAPTLASAALNRGILQYQNGNYVQSVDNLKRALQNGADPSACHFNLALVHLARGERSAALINAERALQNTPTHARARDLLDQLQVSK